MEQPPKGMPVEQLPLDLGNHESQLQPDVPETKEIDMETLDIDTLRTLYTEAVGKDPKWRALDRSQLITGIQDPKAELNRLATIDTEDDRAQRNLGRAHY